MTWWAWLLVGWVPFAVLLARLLGAAARAIHARDQRCWESSPATWPTGRIDTPPTSLQSRPGVRLSGPRG